MVGAEKREVDVAAVDLQLVLESRELFDRGLFVLRRNLALAEGLLVGELNALHVGCAETLNLARRELANCFLEGNRILPCSR